MMFFNFITELPFPKKINLRWFLLTLAFIEGIWHSTNMVFSALDAEEMLDNAVMRLDFYRPGAEDNNLTRLSFATAAFVARGWILMATIGLAYAVFKRGHGYINEKLIDIYAVMNNLTIGCAVIAWITLATKHRVIGEFFLQNDAVQVLDVIFDFLLPLATTYMVIVFKQRMMKRERLAEKIYKEFLDITENSSLG